MLPQILRHSHKIWDGKLLLLIAFKRGKTVTRGDAIEDVMRVAVVNVLHSKINIL
jgi:hypothetical protein